MRGYLIQGPSLACQFRDLAGAGHIPLSAYPHTGLSCSLLTMPLISPTYTHTSRIPALRWLSPDPTWGESRACTAYPPDIIPQPSLTPTTPSSIDHI